jgi:hypothetical protein
MYLQSEYFIKVTATSAMVSKNFITAHASIRTWIPK